MDFPAAIRDLCEAFLGGLKAALGEKLVGVYIYGAWAFPETSAAGDVDFHVILRSELTDDERLVLERLHESLAARFPPLGDDMDGYYILLSDALGESPPRSQMWKRARDDAWALHREHVRAGRCIVLYGPDPTQIYPPASWTEVERALLGELDYVEEHLVDYPAYCVLNLCRLMYSFRTGDVVVSKARSAGWALEAFPEWKDVIEAAKKSYEKCAAQQDEELLLSKVRDFLDFAYESLERP